MPSNRSRQVRVSVIMPAYNSAAYIAQALESLMFQDCDDFEVLIVDDGSTDDTAFIVQAYAEQDERLHLLRQEHQGAGAARNYGMDQACGDYLLFLDADDVFESQLISHLLGLALSTSADLTVCSADCFTHDPLLPSRRWEAARSELRDGFYKRHDLNPRLYQCLSVVVWNKLWKRECIEAAQLRFQNLPRFNDAFFTIMGLAQVRSIAKTNEVLVHYRVGGGSSLMDQSYRCPLCDIEALDAARAELSRKGLLTAGLKQSFDTLCVNTITWRLAQFARSSRDACRQLYASYYGTYRRAWGLEAAGFSATRSPRYALEHFLMQHAGADGLLWAAQDDARDRSSATNIEAELRFAARLALAALRPGRR